MKKLSRNQLEVWLVVGGVGMVLVWLGQMASVAVKAQTAPTWVMPKANQTKTTIQPPQLSFDRSALQSAAYHPPQSSVSIPIREWQSAGWGENVVARGFAAERIYAYQINGYISPPAKSAEAGVLLADYFQDSPASADAMVVTLNSVAARCGIPIISEFMVNQARFSREFILIQIEMMLLKLPAQAAFESSLYQGEINWQQSTPCEHFVAETAFQ